MAISSENTDDDSRKSLSLGGFVWRAALVLLTLTIICCSGVSYWHFTTRQKAVAELNAVIAKIRSQNGPLTGEEIEAYYAIPEGEEDLTREYLQAIRVFDNLVLSKEQQQLPIVGSTPTTPKPPQVGEEWELLPLAEEYLQKVQPQLQTLRELADRRGSVRYPTKLSDGIAALLPHAQQLRSAARHLKLQFHVSLHRGDRATALATLKAIFKSGDTLQKEPTLISQLVRIAITGIGTEATADFLRHGQATEEELKTLADFFATFDQKKSLQTAMQGERAMSFLAMQLRDMSALEPATGGTGLSTFGSLGTLMELRPGDAAHLLAIESEMVEATELPYPETLLKLREIEKRVKQMATDEKYSLPWNRHLLAQLLVPAVANVAEAFGRSMSQLESLRTAVKVEQFHLQKGKYPQTLAELVPDFLPQVPVDPFTNGSLRYRRDEESYTIYSVGVDLIDGGGDVSTTASRPPDVGVRVETK